MTDDISAEIQQSIYTEKVNTYYSEALDSWIGEHEIVRSQEAIDALTAAAQEQEAEEAAE